jgi:phage baseplate assembly protein W
MFLRKHFLGGGPLADVDDVIENLRNVLGTRRGTGYFLPTFGVSDFGYRTPEEMVVTLTAEIRENLRLYEPRVEVVDVDEDWDDAGKRTKLVVRMRLRERDERLEVTVDLEKRSFDVRAVAPRGAR